jgi:hypothetical protein
LNRILKTLSKTEDVFSRSDGAVKFEDFVVWKGRFFSPVPAPCSKSGFEAIILSEAGYTEKRYGKKLSLCLERTLK